MKILVCVKQVPEPDFIPIVDGLGASVSPKGKIRYQMNEFDACALEEALRIKDRLPGAIIDALTVGPPGTEEVLKRAVGMGADGAVHLLTSEDDCPDPFSTACWIASVAEERGYDLILAGVMSQDEMQGLLGPLIAGYLNLPCATAVVSKKLSDDGASVEVERELEGGLRLSLDLPLPALLTIQTGINKARYPSLSNVLRARQMEAETIGVPTLCEVEARQTVVRISSPEKSRAGVMLEGSLEDKAERLARLLREKGFWA